MEKNGDFFVLVLFVFYWLVTKVTIGVYAI